MASKQMTLVEIMQSLIGQTLPIGQHGADMQTLRNLDEVDELVHALIDDLIEAAKYHDYHLDSMCQIGKRAAGILADIQAKLNA